MILSVLAMLLSVVGLGVFVIVPAAMIHGGRGTFRGHRLVLALSGYVYALGLLVAKDMLDGPPDNYPLSFILAIGLGGGGTVILMLRRYGLYQRVEEKDIGDTTQSDKPK